MPKTKPIPSQVDDDTPITTVIDPPTTPQTPSADIAQFTQLLDNMPRLPSPYGVSAENYRDNMITAYAKEVDVWLSKLRALCNPPQ